MKRVNSYWARVCLLVTLVLLPMLSFAQVTMQLVSADQSAKPGESTQVALRIQHEPEWHTYWLNAGIGEPTTIRWALPSGWSAGPIEWPTPTAIKDGRGQVTGQGYSELLLLPVTIQVPATAAGTAELRAHVKWVMCSDRCIPGEQDLSLSLPVSEQPPVPDAAVRQELAQMPMPASDARWQVRANTDGSGVRLEVKAPEAVTDAHFFNEDPFIPGDGSQDVAGTPQGLTLSLRTNPEVQAPKSLKGILGFKDGQGRYRGISVKTPLQVASPTTAAAGTTVLQSGASLALPLVLVLGFLGGLILNLMPCVFPVLGIKVLGFLEQAQNDRRSVSFHGIAFTAGVLLSFWALVGVLAVLRAGGASLGWGFQLQSPGFVYLLILVLLVFALSLSGVFEFGVRATSVGGNLQNKGGYWGSVLTGILATVVATPCSAPFLAPALGAALTLPLVESFLAFTSIGLGLAAPYLLLSIFPQAVRWLPRPGRWMETFRQLMAFPLYATVAWLVWVLAGQTTDNGLFMALLGLVVVAMAIWLRGRYQSLGAGTRKTLITSAASLLLLVGGSYMGFPRATPPQELTWEPWSKGRVAELQAEGRPIYVDFTARWCATCQTNKKIVFASQDVRDTVRAMNVAMLKADWTNADPEITKELARWNRSAVPFNLVYLPGESAPRVLPELLTPSIVMDALAAKSPAP